MKQVQATVTKNESVSEICHHSRGRVLLNSQLIWLNCPQIASEAHPGQFVMVRCGQECTLPRPFSIHQVNDAGDIALFFAVWEDGKGTNWLSRRHIGDTVNLLGPLGNGFSVQPGSHNLLLLAGGVGIAPLYFLAQEALRRECSVTLLYGTANENRYPEHLIPSDIELIAATEDGTVGRKGMITDFLPDFVDRAGQVFACGPTEMYHDMALRKKELKLEGKAVQISLEVRMGCGLGVCYGCTVKTKKGLKQVCKDGPIFNLDDILWDELAQV
ncbi:Dihydroorotate dehydrogenase B (NAD(+)), electron transfer subunit [subsurface metagenome]